MKKLYIPILVMISAMNTVSFTQDFEEVHLAYDPDSAIFDNFGYSVSISGNYIVIGAHLESEDENGENTMIYAGSAFIYERDENGTWNPVQKIVASDRHDTTIFGNSVDISGNYIIVGAHLNDRDATGSNYIHNAGAAYLFKRDTQGNWNEVQKIVASDRDSADYFGFAVSISGNLAVVGAHREDDDTIGLNTLNSAGSAYIFYRDANDNWNEMQKIVASDRAESDYFGESVSISDEFLIVGAKREDEDSAGMNPMEDPGSAYIFELNGTHWNEVQKITAPVRGNYDLFGSSMDISGDYAIVGARLESEDAEETNYLQYAGSAYIFERSSTGIWNLADKIVASDRAEDDVFGSSVSIWNNYAIVGAPEEDQNAFGEDSIEDAGSAYIFHRDATGSWSEIQKIVTFDRGYVDYAGSAVGISGDYVILGRGAQEPHWAGAANIFEACNPGTGGDPDNIIVNGEFSECVLSPWTTYTGTYVGQAFTWQLIDGECILSPHALSATPQVYDMQLTQVFSSSQMGKLTEGTDYTLSFDACAETSNRLIQVIIDLDEDPWTPVLSENIYLSTDMESYDLDFTLSPKFPNMKLGFDFGSEFGAITLDNVRLVEKEESSVNALSVIDHDVYYCPDAQCIKVINAENCIMDVYNSAGMYIGSAIIGNNDFSYPATDMNTGIIIIRIRSESINTLSKLMVY